MSAEKVEFDGCKAIYDTGVSLRVVIDGKKYWIPHSQIHNDSEVFDDSDNAEGKLVITEFIANLKGMI